MIIKSTLITITYLQKKWIYARINMTEFLSTIATLYVIAYKAL